MSSSTSRREFLKRSSTLAAMSAAGSVLGGLSIARGAHAAGSEEIKLAFIGCGGRGTGACAQALSTKGPVKLVAMADVFPDRLAASLANLKKQEAIKDRIDVPQERQFVGFDAYQKAIDAGVDMVLLTTPPHFRPVHYAAAVKAGKHIYMEKPVAIDAPGVRAIQEANEQAKKKGLVVAVGFQYRHLDSCREQIRQIRDGETGAIRCIRTYYLMPGSVSGSKRPPNQTEMEYQLRRWPYFTWLSGDHFVEQHVHACDVGNWAADAVPVKAHGVGGRQVRVGPGTGQIFDHGVVEFEYPNGCRHFAFARQIPGCFQEISQFALGTKKEIPILGKRAEFSKPNKEGRNVYQYQHDRLFAALRAGEPFFEGDYGATSSMTAILGRMALYSGKEVTWEQAIQSQLRLAPTNYAWDAQPPAIPNADGTYPVAMPGVTVAW